jgi:hypothetical protein
MSELAFVTFAEGFAEIVNQLAAGRGDFDVDHASVGRVPDAAHEFAVFELVEHAGDVGGTRDESRRQFESGDGMRVCVREEPEDVVLLGGEAVAAKEFFFEGFEAVVGSPESEEDLLLEGVEAW